MKGKTTWLVVQLVTLLALAALLLAARVVAPGGETHRALCEAVDKIAHCELRSSPDLLKAR